MSKGQVTLFIIIGIVILIAVVILLFVLRKDVQEQLPDIPNTFLPVSHHVETCLKETVREAVDDASQHGGYPAIDDEEISGRQFTQDVLHPTEADVVLLGDTYGIPYWLYLSSSNDCQDCVFDSLAPELPEIENQLSRYVNKHIDECLDFNVLRSQGFEIIINSTPSSKVFINEKDVSARLNYTLVVQRNDEQFTLTAFHTVLNIPLKEMYILALNITQAEANTQFLENVILYELNTYGGTRADLLPPSTEQSVEEYSYLMWGLSRTKLQFMQLMSRDMNAVQVRGALNARYITGNTTQERRFYEATALNIFPNVTFNDTTIDVVYMNWDPYFVIQPSDGEIISQSIYEGGSFTSFVPSRRFSNYHFFYDISLPVVVQITKHLPEGETVRFLFALEANIRENKRLPEWIAGLGTIPWNYENIGFLVNGMGDSFTDPSGETYSLERLNASVIFCDPKQRISAPVKIRTYDTRTREPLEGVEVTFGCGRHVSCPEGDTQYNVSSRRAEFIGKLPLCMNGYASLKKAGYWTKVIPLTPSMSESVSVGAYLERLVDKNVSVMKVQLTRAGDGFAAQPAVPLGENETVVLTLVKNVTGLEEPLSTTLVLQGNESKIASLVTGMYAVTGTFMSTHNIIIPRNCDRNCIERNWLRECTNWLYYPSSDINLTGMPSGGIEMDRWRVYQDDLDEDNVLVINILVLPDPPCLQEMEWFGKIKEFSEQFMIQPVFMNSTQG
ncbi:MAG: hypothetical protein V1725_01560 [archaeon]